MFVYNPTIKGDTGDTGAAGAQGDQGIQGIQGIQGVQGDAGVSGIFPSQCSVKLSADMAINTATDTKVTFNQASFDNNSEFDIITNNRYVSKVDGMYAFAAQIKVLNLNVGTLVTIYVRKNGNPLKKEIKYHQGGNDEYADVDGLIDLDVDDYIEVWARHDNGDQQNVEHNFYDTYFDIHRVA